MTSNEYTELSSKKLKELVEKLKDSRALLEEHCDTEGIKDADLKATCDSMRTLGQSLLCLADGIEERDRKFKAAMEDTDIRFAKTLQKLAEL